MTPDQPLSIAEALQLAARTHHLPQLEAQVLLAHVLQTPRSHLYAWPEQPLNAAQRIAFLTLLERRQQGEPVAYLTGQREFWSLSLRVTPDTLIPRPETELLVEQALALLDPGGDARVADLGTGSGAIAAAIASERPRARLLATDISAAALAVAADNFRRLGLRRIETRQGNWCSALHPGERFDLILSNPPYVAEGDPHLLRDGLPWEPATALSSGADGLDDIRRLIGGAPDHLAADGWLLIEHGLDQGSAVRRLFDQAGYLETSTHQDLAAHDRLTRGKRPPAIGAESKGNQSP
ncbi:peptide chain release factor N(5)-glutamine methyltransferase [Sedimenticola selenatireducens]|uniref:peptide chain release factor N(5)-glutamine methyltransferase n=1 Tax=Sedimenticola selenatireducens TaxID=191960 RepID=UPI0004BBA045|nr:peptide chain release factor N(5)-glutamine methyltransferase [Sedimenticola selenatireducens]